MITTVSTKHSSGNYGSSGTTHGISCDKWLDISEYKGSHCWVMYRSDDEKAVFHSHIGYNKDSYDLMLLAIHNCTSPRMAYPVGTVIVFTQDQI